MTFLAKFGAAVLKGIQIVSGVAPFAQAAAPSSASAIAHVQSELALLAGVIQQAEVFGQALSLPGAQKLTAAAPAVAQVILSSSLMAGKKVNDAALFKSGAEKMASGLADILNSWHEHGVETDDKHA